MSAKKAIIVESPTKTRTLSGFLPDDYTLVASMGHVRDLPESGMGVDLEGDFEPTYVVSGKRAIGQLKKALKDVDEIYLATDPDREGEAIAWHIMDELGLRSARRIQFNEITREAVLDALEHPGEIDMDRVDAQQARLVLDRLVGNSLSPELWKKVGGSGGKRGAGLSAGRVQSVALRLITDRERERAAFVPVEWWSISALLQPDGREQFEAELKTVDGEEAQLATEEDVTPLVEELSGEPFVVGAIEEKQQKRNPQPPFITSTLQGAASTRLRYGARKTMQVAQQLYEGIETGDGSPVSSPTCAPLRRTSPPRRASRPRTSSRASGAGSTSAPARAGRRSRARRRLTRRSGRRTFTRRQRASRTCSARISSRSTT